MDLVRLGALILDVDDMDTHDQRTRVWWTLRTPYPVFFIIFVYVYFIAKFGPQFMKGRKPYDLKTFIKWYNIFQIIANGAIIYYTIKYGLFTEIPLSCVKMDTSAVGNPMKMAELFWYVWILKTIDFIETCIFVLRKKDKQITGLHLYHHISTMLFSWASMKLQPGGSLTIHATTNSLIHVIMYSYYYVSSCGPEIQRFVAPYKKYITILQMVQFVLLTLHAIQGLNPECNLPQWGVHLVIGNLAMNFVLFSNFYRATYWKTNLQNSVDSPKKLN